MWASLATVKIQQKTFTDDEDLVTRASAIKMGGRGLSNGVGRSNHHVRQKLPPKCAGVVTPQWGDRLPSDADSPRALLLSTCDPTFVRLTCTLRSSLDFNCLTKILKPGRSIKEPVSESSWDRLNDADSFRS